MTVTAIYLVKGEYFYSTTARTFNQPGTLEFAGEISNTVSQIEQFSKSEKVEGSYFSDLSCGNDIRGCNQCRKSNIHEFV